MNIPQGQRGKSALVDLAAAKNLPLGWLKKLGVRDADKDAIGITYFGETGEVLYERTRNPPEAEERFLYKRGTKPCPYGLQKLGEARRDGRLYIAEGESDTWTLWHCSLPALGIPGGKMVGKLMTEHVESIADVYLLADNDDAGEQFVEGVRRRLMELDYHGRLWHVQVPKQYKDVSDWYVSLGIHDFRTALKEAVADAVQLHIEARRPSRASITSEARPPNCPSPAPEEWAEPIPLSELPSPPPFPLNVLPESLKQFVGEAAASIPCPPDYVAVPMLAISGAAIGASRALEIKHGRMERPALYVAVVGVPSCGKTPCLTFAARPLYKEQARLYEIYRRERRAHEDGADDAPKPTERVVHVSDITTEKLASVLQDNPRGVIVVRDELTGWVRSMDQYRSGKGADKQFWLSAWSGDPIAVHRKMQDAGPIRVAHPFVAAAGGLPPDLLEMMRGDRAVSDGFLDRILFSYPDPYPAAGESWRCIPEECEAQWAECLTRLWALQMESVPEHGPRPRLVRLTTCGRAAWKNFTDDLAAERNDESTPDCIRSALGKMNSYGARLALIVHCLRVAAGEVDGDDVDGESIDRAGRLVTYFQGHARRVYAAMDADPRVADGRKLLHWIVSNRPWRFQKRDAYQGTKGTFKTVEELEPALTLLQKHGYIRIEPAPERSGPGRKPSPAYEVHPSLLQPDSHNSHNSHNGTTT